MTKLRKLRPTIWITLVVYLLIVGSGTAMAGRCCYLDGERSTDDAEECAHFHENAAVPAAHDCSSESDRTADGDPCCNCSILPIGAANSSVLPMGVVASSVWMHGASYSPCLIGSPLNSSSRSVGGRYPPLVSDFKPILNSLQTVFLLI
ncbi:MAG: hypothetical protein ACLP5H_27605 [Desulfomonilaceae bacterium]